MHGLTATKVDGSNQPPALSELASDILGHVIDCWTSSSMINEKLFGASSNVAKEDACQSLGLVGILIRCHEVVEELSKKLAVLADRV